MDILFTLKIFIIIIIGFLVITSWDEVIDRTLMKYLNLDREKISSWVIISLISTAALFLILVLTNIELHDIFGVSETADTQLTGQVENIVSGQVIHSKV